MACYLALTCSALMRGIELVHANSPHTVEMRLLAMLVNGDWSDDEFLVVPPGKAIKQTNTPGLIAAR